MKKYNVFNQTINKENMDYFQEDVAQSTALLDAAELIAEAMQEKGINQTNLAKELNVTDGYISRLLSGSENMSLKKVARVLNALGKKYIQETVDIKKYEEIKIKLQEIKKNDIIKSFSFSEKVDLPDNIIEFSSLPKRKNIDKALKDWNQESKIG